MLTDNYSRLRKYQTLLMEIIYKYLEDKKKMKNGVLSDDGKPLKLIRECTVGNPSDLHEA